MWRALPQKIRKLAVRSGLRLAACLVYNSQVETQGARIVAGVALGDAQGVGLYGEWFQCEMAPLGRAHALVLSENLWAHRVLRGTLLDAAQLANWQRLQHPALIPLLGFATEGAYAVVLTPVAKRYVTAYDLVLAARARGDLLDERIVAAIVLPVLDALAAMHAAGIWHGAVHPRSVQIDDTGHVRLADLGVGLGLATAISSGADVALWRDWSGYVAPELLIGERPGPASDVYSAAALLVSLCSAEVPPPEPTVEAPPWADFVGSALGSDPSQRGRDVSELRDRVELGLAARRIGRATATELAQAVASADPLALDAGTEAALLGINQFVAAAPMRRSRELAAEQLLLAPVRTVAPATALPMDAPVALASVAPASVAPVALAPVNPAPAAAVMLVAATPGAAPPSPPAHGGDRGTALTYHDAAPVGGVVPLARERSHEPHGDDAVLYATSDTRVGATTPLAVRVAASPALDDVLAALTQPAPASRLPEEGSGPAQPVRRSDPTIRQLPGEAELAPTGALVERLDRRVPSRWRAAKFWWALAAVLLAVTAAVVAFR